MYELQSVIWDFNGTILDDTDLVVRTINRLLRDRNLRTTTVVQHRASFGFPVEEYYHTLGFDLQREPFGDVSREYHDHYLSGIAECTMHAGTERLLALLRRSGVRQFILSAMQQELLEEAVRSLGVHHYFEAIYGLDDLMARSKESRGTALLKGYDIDPAKTLYIGDTDHDVEVAEALGCISVGIGAGHQTAERFDPERTHVFRSFAELADAIDPISSSERAAAVRFTPAETNT